MRFLMIESNWTMMALSQELTQQGTLVTRTDRPEDVMHYLRDGEQDLVLLPEALFGNGGLSLPLICAAAGSTPVCLLTERTTPDQRAALLNAGAAALVDSRADSREIIARLRAVARRACGISQPVLSLGTLEIDLENSTASIEGAQIRLSRKVYATLECLALRSGCLVTRDTLMSHVYGLENEPDARVFDVYLCKLRAELNKANAGVAIETVRGKGFRLQEMLREDQPLAA